MTSLAVPGTARSGATANALMAVGGLAAGIAVAALIASSDHRDALGEAAVFTLLEGWAYLAAGLVARVRRPDSRIGLLLAAVGGAWLWTGVQFADDDLAYTVSTATAGLFYPLFLWVVLGFPDGRLRSRPAALVVGAAWAAFAVLSAVFVAQGEQPSGSCESCLRDVFPAVPGTAGSAALTVVSNVVAVGLALAAVVLTARRHRAASPPARRALAPVLTAAAVATAVLAAHQLSRLVVDGGSQVTFYAAYTVFTVAPLAFLAALVRDRLARSTVLGRLVGRLEGVVDAGALRSTLAHALGDPSLDLAFATADGPGFVDPRGAPADVAGAAARGRAVTEVRDGTRVVAAMVHDRELLADPELMRSVAAAAAIALDRARLEAELRAGLEQLQSSRARIVEAADDARRRIERDLHDGAQQRLVALSLLLATAQRRLEGERPDPGGANELLARARAELDASLSELRELARGIHPAVLTDRGLVAALEALADRASLPVDVDARLEERCAPAVEAAAYFVVLEALANVQKYAGAAAATIVVGREGDTLVVEVADDGAGGADPAGGSGLRGLADRVEALGGTLAVESPPGRGTRVSARLPC